MPYSTQNYVFFRTTSLWTNLSFLNHRALAADVPSSCKCRPHGLGGRHGVRHPHVRGSQHRDCHHQESWFSWTGIPGSGWSIQMRAAWFHLKPKNLLVSKKRSLTLNMDYFGTNQHSIAKHKSGHFNCKLMSCPLSILWECHKSTSNSLLLWK